MNLEMLLMKVVLLIWYSNAKIDLGKMTKINGLEIFDSPDSKIFVRYQTSYSLFLNEYEFNMSVNKGGRNSVRMRLKLMI